MIYEILMRSFVVSHDGAALVNILKLVIVAVISYLLYTLVMLHVLSASFLVYSVSISLLLSYGSCD